MKQNKYDSLRAQYPPGTRVRLIEMAGDPNPIPPGTMGTVRAVDDAGQLVMAWDNGRCLSLIPGVDSFEKAAPKMQLGGMHL